MRLQPAFWKAICSLIPARWEAGYPFRISGVRVSFWHFPEFDGTTDYESGVVARTLDDSPGIEIMLPAQATLQFGDRRIGEVQLTSDTFQITTEKGRTRGAFADAHHILCQGPVTVGQLSPGLRVATKELLTLIGPEARFNPELLRLDLAHLIDQRQSWMRRHVAPHGLSERRRRTLSKALSVMKGQVCTPEGLLHHRWTTPDRWPHRDLWLWDSVFHALGWRHVDPSLAREMIEAVFDGQQPDGMIPHQASPVAVSSITQPPVLALGIQMVAGQPADLTWIEKLYPGLSRYIEWDLKNRIAPGEDLAHWRIDANPLSRCAESGMDNSPRFDSGAQLEVVDLNSFLSLECSIMAGFARALGRAGDAERWSGHHAELNQLINARLWNEEAGFYFDYDPAQRRQTEVFAVSGFFPLLCGAASEHQVRRLAAHLDNPRTFATAAPIASAVLTPETSRPHDMWRGPLWMNTNWLTALGFERSGRPDVALKLRRQSLGEIERWYLERGSIFEFYDEFGVTPPDSLPRKGSLVRGSASHQAVHDYGWTATLYADLVYTTSD